ncbi:hypothetical protein D3C81_2246120 [compost metagenome]
MTGIIMAEKPTPKMSMQTKNMQMVSMRMKHMLMKSILMKLRETICILTRIPG